MTTDITETGIVIPPEQRREITPLMLLDRALSHGADMATLEKFMELSERHDRNQARKAFDAAIAAAKAEMPVIRKNRTVDFVGKTGIRTNYVHEDLAEIAKTIDPILGKHGLSYRFRTASPPNEPITVTCIVSHRDGYSEENTLSAGRDDSGNKNSIQAIGSAITFLQRYTLKASLGLAAAHDDDGRASGDATNGKGSAPGATGPISHEQLVDLLEFIEIHDAEPSKILTRMNVTRFEDIPAAGFAQLMTSLQAWAEHHKKPTP